MNTEAAPNASCACTICGHDEHGDVTCQLPRLVGDRWIACGCFGEPFYLQHGVPPSFTKQCPACAGTARLVESDGHPERVCDECTGNGWVTLGHRS